MITQFTPLASTIGGVLIGVAAVMLMAFSGRIARISGILGRLFHPYADADPRGAAFFVLGNHLALSRSRCGHAGSGRADTSNRLPNSATKSVGCSNDLLRCSH